MGTIDLALKNLLKDKETFADLFNGTLFHGEQVIQPETLQELPTEQIRIFYEEEEKAKADHIVKYRDIIMESTQGLCHLILGCENQKEIDYSMPVRTMIYDALTYGEQIRQMTLQKSSKGKYYHGKLKKEERLEPVLTIVVYWGDTSWEGKNSIHEMIEWPTDCDIQKYIPNYKMNRLDVNQIKNEKIYKSDLQFIFETLKYKKDKQRMRNHLQTKGQEFQKLDEASKIALLELLQSETLKSWYEEKKEAFDMCKALDDLVNDSKREGERLGLQKGERLGLQKGERLGLQKGERLGLQKGERLAEQRIILRMAKSGMDIDAIVNITEMKREDVERMIFGEDEKSN